jgi:hypothetical protein
MIMLVSMPPPTPAKPEDKPIVAPAIENTDIRFLRDWGPGIAAGVACRFTILCTQEPKVC